MAAPPSGPRLCPVLLTGSTAARPLFPACDLNNSYPSIRPGRCCGWSPRHIRGPPNGGAALRTAVVSRAFDGINRSASTVLDVRFEQFVPVYSSWTLLERASPRCPRATSGACFCGRWCGSLQSITAGPDSYADAPPVPDRETQSEVVPKQPPAPRLRAPDSRGPTRVLVLPGGDQIQAK